MRKRARHNQLTRDECIKILRRSLPELQEKFDVRSLAIFGSVARNRIHRQSDVDVLARFSVTPTLFTLIKMENYLSKLLGKKVDLVMENSMKPDGLNYMNWV